MNQFIDNYQDAHEEHAYVFSKDKSLIHVEGTPTSIFFSGVSDDQLKDSVIIHNHPQDGEFIGGSFSDADLKLLLEKQPAELYAIDEQFIYRVWYTGDEKKFDQELWQSGFNKAIDLRLAEGRWGTLDEKHDIMQVLAKDWSGIHYGRQRISEKGS
ncbi:hypothetical protein [Enterococcus sp. CSURQ0835]|uniref:hypothetical protein n=1 Tax=Enterococcus sp. CSURQ0835 TaxID=2681394 RepID=UPI001358CFA6|nr:hypothetical protein [Enterococcus sp. CSURQ0835]